MLTKNTAEFRQRVADHIAADAVVGGNYWEAGYDNDVGGFGCFIGCTTHSDDVMKLESMWGFPAMLGRICEDIFERLPESEQPIFFDEIGEAMDRDGKDLSLVGWKFLHGTLLSMPKVDDKLQAAINVVIYGIGNLATGGAWDSDAAHAAAHAVAYDAERTRQRQSIIQLIAAA